MIVFEVSPVNALIVQIWKAPCPAFVVRILQVNHLDVISQPSPEHQQVLFLSLVENICQCKKVPTSGITLFRNCVGGIFG